MNSKDAANAAYKQRAYDRILVQMPKGTREKLKAVSDAAGMSVNRYILEAVEARSGLKLTLDNALPWMDPNKRKSEEGEK